MKDWMIETVKVREEDMRRIMRPRPLWFKEIKINKELQVMGYFK